MDADLALHEISNLFQAADKDQSGSLSRTEIAAVMTRIKMGVYPSETELSQCMALIDKNSDGVITKEDFIAAMAQWLGISLDAGCSGNRLRSRSDLLESTSSNMANFFRQFEPVTNITKQQELIMHRTKPELNQYVILHEFPSLTSEQKLMIHSGATATVSAGKISLLTALHSLDWHEVLLAAMKVRDLLALVEIFHDTEER